MPSPYIFSKASGLVTLNFKIILTINSSVSRVIILKCLQKKRLGSPKIRGLIQMTKAISTCHS